MTNTENSYYLPDPSHWPIIGSIGLFSIFFGGAVWLNGSGVGPWLLVGGFIIFIYMLIGWFGIVIRESEAGAYNDQVDDSFRMGMLWFIFSEVMFFACFFGALFYARILSVPWLSGEGVGFMTNYLLWPDFSAVWPTDVMPDPSSFKVYVDVVPAWGVPALNTFILLASGVTITLAHWAIKEGNRKGLVRWLFATFTLGFIFVGFQAQEYIHAYHDLNLTLNSGIYASTFFMLTGFHGFHVTLGAIMIVVIWARSLKGHFTEERHFAFEAVAWYWHFVDVVWLLLFVAVYWV
ncbi:MAG: cytochrome c oxidase subunit 3 [Gammaproteobacteria bacterium]|jgi:cytochrome c oxidase subunit 3